MNYKLILLILLFTLAISCQNSSDKKELMVEEFNSYSQPFDFSYPDSLEYIKHDFGMFCEILFMEFPIEEKTVRCELTYFKSQLMIVNFIIEPKDYRFFKKRYTNQNLSLNIGFEIFDGSCSQNPGMPNYIANTYCFQWGNKRLLEEFSKYYTDKKIEEVSPIKQLFYDLIY